MPPQDSSTQERILAIEPAEGKVVKKDGIPLSVQIPNNWTLEKEYYPDGNKPNALVLSSEDYTILILYHENSLIDGSGLITDKEFFEKVVRISVQDREIYVPIIEKNSDHGEYNTAEIMTLKELFPSDSKFVGSYYLGVRAGNDSYTIHLILPEDKSYDEEKVDEMYSIIKSIEWGD